MGSSTSGSDAGAGEARDRGRPKEPPGGFRHDALWAQVKARLRLSLCGGAACGWLALEAQVGRTPPRMTGGGTMTTGPGSGRLGTRNIFQLHVQPCGVRSFGLAGRFPDSQQGLQRDE